ncbi:MAG: S9 family peptidase [Crocinitomicaceae bacterium]|nr:S9 family peptidase [Crocinitomicaceae bacterium]
MTHKIPFAPKKNKTLVQHGHQRIDSYYWMNERDSPEVLANIQEENDYASHYFKPILPLQEFLLDEFEARINPNDVGASFFIQNRKFQYQSIENKDYHQIIEWIGDEKTIFFDENQRAENQSFYQLGDWMISPDNQLTAFSEDCIGRRNYSIRFRNETTGEILKDEILNTDGTCVWANDSKTVFYIRKDSKTLREFQVYKHVIGTDSNLDELIFEELDERFYVAISKEVSKQYLVIHIESSLTSEIRLIDANLKDTIPKVFLKREKGHLYEVFPHEHGFYISSNKNAPNQQILFYSEFPTPQSLPTVVVAHDKNILIEDFLVLKNHLFIQKRINGLQQIEIKEIATGISQHVNYPEETYSSTFAHNQTYDASDFYLNYTSLSLPKTVFKYCLNDHQTTVYFQKELRDPKFKSTDYQTKRIFAIANDGTKIPVSLLFHKETILAEAPLLLEGYGSYGITIPSTFNPYLLSLVNRGFVYAIAHIRGGKYMGETWYENGKFQKKRNTFTDFINAAEFLGNQQLCDSSKIYAQGGSAGGLLMGAVANMAPYLWKGIIAQVPFVDVLTTMLDEELPLTVGEYEEWGNPQKEDVYWYMLNYSPYDNVRKMNYPAMYITTGYHDSQVQYWEPQKWVAKLRAYKTDQNPLLFDCNMDSGHGGGSGRSTQRLEIAKEYSFILNLEGIEK